MAGSRATEACEPRQVRKEAAAAMSAVCCGKPGHRSNTALSLANLLARKSGRCPECRLLL